MNLSQSSIASGAVDRMLRQPTCILPTNANRPRRVPRQQSCTTHDKYWELGQCIASLVINILPCVQHCQRVPYSGRLQCVLPGESAIRAETGLRDFLKVRGHQMNDVDCYYARCACSARNVASGEWLGAAWDVSKSAIQQAQADKRRFRTTHTQDDAVHNATSPSPCASSPVCKVVTAQEEVRLHMCIYIHGFVLLGECVHPSCRKWLPLAPPARCCPPTTLPL